MNEQRIEEIKNAVRELMSLVLDSGTPLTDQIREMLSQAMEHAATRIQQIREEESPVDELSPGQEQQEPELNPAGMPSSNINSFGYDEDTGRLLVKFQGDYPQQNGPVYAYGGVPKQIFDLFRTGAVPARTDGKNKWGSWWKGKVPSLGASLFTLIKGGNYPYQKLS